MIKVDRLSRRYGKAVAVDDVSFEIQPNEVVGLLGHNGAGKTTIMKMLTGSLEPTAGSVIVEGTDISADRKTVQSKIGYLPESSPLYPEMTVVDYLDYVASLKEVPTDCRRERLIYAISKTSIAEVADKRISTLSRGYRQRLGIAQAILNKPRILILDEPTNGLDPSQIVEMRALIGELAQSSTVIISTHILQEVQAMCSRVIIIKQGKLALDCALSKLQASHRVSLTVSSKLDESALNLKDLRPLQAVDVQENERGHFVYTLELSQAADVEEVIPQLVLNLTAKGYKIFSIYPILRDLETIFRNLSLGYDVEDFLGDRAAKDVTTSVVLAGQSDSVIS